MTVLVVDDNDEIRLLVVEALAIEGYAVREAIHGREALDLLERGAHDLPSVIVLDLMMPFMDGRELMSRLAASDRLRRIPVVATTALPHLAQGHGFAGILAKPFELRELVDEVRRHAPARGEG